MGSERLVWSRVQPGAYSCLRFGFRIGRMEQCGRWMLWVQCDTEDEHDTGSFCRTLQEAKDKAQRLVELGDAADRMAKPAKS